MLYDMDTQEISGSTNFKLVETASTEFIAVNALQINGRSSILLCYMGMALAKLNRHKEASRMLQNAIAADPHNPLARFELANVLVDAHCFNEALQELELLKVLAIPSQQNTHGIDLCLKSFKIVHHIK